MAKYLFFFFLIWWVGRLSFSEVIETVAEFDVLLQLLELQVELEYLVGIQLDNSTL